MTGFGFVPASWNMTAGGRTAMLSMSWSGESSPNKSRARELWNIGPPGLGDRAAGSIGSASTYSIDSRTRRASRQCLVGHRAPFEYESEESKSVHYGVGRSRSPDAISRLPSETRGRLSPRLVVHADSDRNYQSAA